MHKARWPVSGGHGTGTQVHPGPKLILFLPHLAPCFLVVRQSTEVQNQGVVTFGSPGMQPGDGNLSGGNGTPAGNVLGLGTTLG